MNIIFMRHGEAVDNVRGVLSCKEIRCSVLTEAGFRQVAKSVSKLPREIDKIYSSPLIRTLQFNLFPRNLPLSMPVFCVPATVLVTALFSVLGGCAGALPRHGS